MPRVYSTDIPPVLPGRDPVAVMDAECAVCSFGARMIHRLDRGGTVRILPVQSELGRAVLGHFGLRADDPETWLFIADGKVWRDFDAVLEFARRAGSWARLLGLLAVFPGPMRDWLYRRLARNRYAVFGRADLCALPDPGLRRRLMT